MLPDQEHQKHWTINDAARTYNLAEWSDGYFGISAEGHLIARHRQGDANIDLYALVVELRRRGLELPILVRFRHILRDRFDRLCNAFDTARKRHDYAKEYTAVYPIKVNQQRSVVNEFLRHGRSRIGLEAGSKPELMAVMALMENPDGVIICNGYKDSEYVRLALIGRLLGHRIYIVIERLSELSLVLREAKVLGVKPLLGIRVRLASIGKGKWQNTGGERAKFGLSAVQALNVVARLQKEGAGKYMQLLHFHMGSQIPDIGDIEAGMREASRYYAEFRRAGIDIRVLDVGGGLGIDYEGSGTTHYCSMNYSLEQYAETIVQVITEICRDLSLPRPALMTETGRAMTAHHAVLVTNVIDVEHASPDTSRLTAPDSMTLAALERLWLLYQSDAQSCSDSVYRTAESLLEEVHTQYAGGSCDLSVRAAAEQIHTAICQRLRQQGVVNSDIAEALHAKLAAKYFCNFSVFQSVPDVWAFNQIFPIMPLHRLDEEPAQRAILHDLTCDSDGQIRAYVDSAGVQSTLPVHDVEPHKMYVLGLFLIGAYQEILGDMHNLFGDTHAIDVELDENGRYRLGEPETGDNVGELLRYVHFDPEQLHQAYRHKLSNAKLPGELYEKCMQQIESGLACYSYHEN